MTSNATIEYNVPNTTNDDVSGGTTTVSARSNDDCAKSSKKLKFGSVDIYTHDIVLGDNPSVSRGPPLTLNWHAIHFERCSVEDFEVRFGQQGGQGGRVKKVSIRSREEWLREMGHRTESLRRVCEEIEYIKRSRQQSQEEIYFTPVEEYLAMAHATSKRQPKTKIDPKLAAALKSPQTPTKKSRTTIRFPRLQKFMKNLAM